MKAQHQVIGLRSALRRIEHRLDVYSGQSTDSPASDDKPALMREPLSQQQQQQQVCTVMSASLCRLEYN